MLDARIDGMGVEEVYGWYLDLRKYGTVPARRLRARVRAHDLSATGMANIRDVIPFPRTPRNADF